MSADRGLFWAPGDLRLPPKLCISEVTTANVQAILETVRKKLLRIYRVALLEVGL